MLTDLLQRSMSSLSTLGDTETRLSYREFYQLLLIEKDRLSTAGVAEQQLVLIEAPNTLNSLLKICALIELKAIAVPYNPKFSPLQLENILQQNNYAFLINAEGTYCLSERFVKSDSELATGIFTSGSTGNPKLVCHQLCNHLENAKAASKINLTNAGDHWHLSLPLFHIGGLSVLFRTLLAGASLTIGGRVEDPDFLVNAGITHASMVPTQLHRFRSNYAGHELCLKAVLVGGGPTSDELLNALPELPLRRTYGMSEISSQACTQGTDGSMHLLECVKLRFTNDSEIQLAGQSLFAGYLEDNKLLKLDDWFNTGDIGYWQNDQLYITGRRDNMFISGGENIQPEAIEKQLLKIEGIKHALVVPIPCQEYGQRPFAWLDCSVAFSQDELQNALSKSLPGYMIPVAFAQIPENLLEQGIKLPRQMLVERAITDLTN